jgi:aspartyl-tRNA(Asn)/glutamyl-tRNA(Gln) amidotransferase subunit C
MIDEKTVKKCAQLARIELKDEEVPRFQKELGKILEFAKTLDEINTDHLKPTLFATQNSNVMREDVVCPWQSPKDLLEQAPESFDGYFKVPRVIE